MEIRVLTLESGRDSSELLYRLDTGQTLTFRLGATLIGVKEPKLWTNYPVDQDQFQRKQYHMVQWNEEKSGTLRKNDSSSINFSDYLDPMGIGPNTLTVIGSTINSHNSYMYHAHAVS